MDVEKAFKESYERLIGSGVGISKGGSRFFARFYEVFFDKSEAVSQKFTATDMPTQIRVLQKGMYQLMSFYLTKKDSQYLHSIAVTHSQSHYDIHPELYDLWLESLLETVEEMDPDYNGAIRLAWQIVMSPGILYLKYHYDSKSIYEADE